MLKSILFSLMEQTGTKHAPSAARMKELMLQKCDIGAKKICGFMQDHPCMIAQDRLLQFLLCL